MSVSSSSPREAPAAGRRGWPWLRAWLLEPVAAVQEAGRRRQALILAGLALVLALSAGVSIFATPRDATAVAARVALTLVAGLSLAAYGLARTRYFTLGAWLLTLSFVAAAFVDVWFGSVSPSGALFSFIPLALVVGAAFLSPWALIALTAVATAGSVSLLGRVADPVEASRVIGALGVNATLGVLLAIGGAVQRAVERDRRAVLVQTNAELQALRASLEIRVEARTHDLAEAQTRTQLLLREVNETARIARLASFDLDLVQQTVSLSDNFFELLGTRAEVHGRALPVTVAVERFIHPQDGAGLLAEIQRQVAEGQAEFETQARFRHAGGEFRFMTLHFRVDRAPDGSAARARGAIQDITERQRVAEELLRFRYSLDRSTDAVFMTDTQGVIQYVNTAFEKTYGYSAAEAIGQTPRLLKSGLLGAEQYQYFWQTLFNKQVVAGEIINRTKDGRLIPVEGANTPILNTAGEIIGFMALHRDITERKRAEAALAKRAAELEITTQLATSIARIADPDVMLQTVVDEVKASFQLYHAHLYLLNEAGDQLVLRAGAGAAGRQMVAQHRTIAFDHPHSLVARAARTRAGVVANDVRLEPDFLPHPLLPLTRSELAVPLVVADDLLGVLDVQAEAVEHFTPEDVRIQTILAAQIAVALENAQSRRRSEQALRELDALTRRLTREGWSEYLTQKGDPHLGYIFADDTVRPLLAGGDPTDAALTRPILMRGEPVGRLVAAGAPAADQAELAVILDAVADGLSTHIDNLRLSEQTRQALAQTETLYAISSQVSNAVSLEAVLQALLQPAIHAEALFGQLIVFDFEAPGRLIAVAVAAEWRRSGPAPSGLGGRRPAAGFPLAPLTTARLMLVENAAVDPRLKPDARGYLEALGARAAAVLPLHAGGRPLGLVLIGWEEPRAFAEAEARLYEALAAQAAVVVNNRLLFEQTRQRADREAIINAISQKIQGTTSVPGALETAIHELGTALKARRATVTLNLAAEAPAGEPAPAGGER